MDKEQQKQLITEIMNDDAKDGLYKKQTAVEWLIEKIKLKYDIDFYHIKKEINQAKEMEKKQIMDAYDDGHSDGYLVARDMEEIVKYTNSEKYYNKEYGKK